MRGKLLDVNFFWQTRQTLACVRPFFFPQDELYAAAPGGESERSGHRAAVSHPEERLNGLPDKAQHAAPKTVAQRSTPRLCAPHGRQTFLLLLEYARVDFCNSLLPTSQLFARTYLSSSLISWAERKIQKQNLLLVFLFLFFLIKKLQRTIWCTPGALHLYFHHTLLG